MIYFVRLFLFTKSILSKISFLQVVWGYNITTLKQFIHAYKYIILNIITFACKIIFIKSNKTLAYL